jgi:hypothetical protein
MRRSIASAQVTGLSWPARICADKLEIDSNASAGLDMMIVRVLDGDTTGYGHGRGASSGGAVGV